MGEKAETAPRTLDDRLGRALLPYLPAGVVSAEGLRWCRGLCRRFPLRICPGVGFECRLGRPVGPVDLALFVSPGESRDILADRHPRLRLDPTFFRAGTWRRLAHFAQDWSVGRLGGEGELEAVWLEFDHPGEAGVLVGDGPGGDAGRGEPPRPKFFAKHQAPFNAGGRPAGEALRATVDGVRGSLGLEPLDGAAAGRLRALGDTLPESGYLFQFGFPLDLEQPPLRVCVRGLSPDEIPGWLRRHFSPEVAEAVRADLAWAGPLLESVDVALDLFDSPGAKVGIECHIDSGYIYPGRWEEFLRCLVERGWSRADRADALRRYSGRVHDLAERDFWGDDDPVRSFKCIGYQRWIHHVKLDYRSDGHREAKAYLGINLVGIQSTGAPDLIRHQVALATGGGAGARAGAEPSRPQR